MAVMSHILFAHTLVPVIATEMKHTDLVQGYRDDGGGS